MGALALTVGVRGSPGPRTTQRKAAGLETITTAVPGREMRLTMISRSRIKMAASDRTSRPPHPNHAVAGLKVPAVAANKCVFQQRLHRPRDASDVPVG